MLIRYRLIAFCLSFALVLGYFKYNASPTTLYKVVSVQNWEQGQLQDKLTLPPMDNDFIHLSTAQQLDKIINKFWGDKPKFVVLLIDAKQLPGKLVFESNPGGSNKYYHLYNGSIPKKSIISTLKVLK